MSEFQELIVNGSRTEVVLNLMDQAVLYKPAGWEVYDQHVPKQLRSFAIDRTSVTSSLGGPETIGFTMPLLMLVFGSCKCPPILRSYILAVSILLGRREHDHGRFPQGEFPEESHLAGHGVQLWFLTSLRCS